MNNRGINLIIFIIALIVSAGVGTQFIAHQFGYQNLPHQPLFWVIYNPIHFFQWVIFSNSETTHETYKIGLIVFILTFMGIFLLLDYFRKNQKLENSDVHGSAEWANENDIKKLGIFNQDFGVYIGAYRKNKSNEVQYLKDNSDKHGILIAPTRSGKTTSLIIPTALSWPGSMFIYDIKGEVWELSSGWRKKYLKSHMIKFEPTCEDGSTACFNPLYEIRVGVKEVADAQNLANMLVDPDGKGNLDHWRLSAQSALVGFILHVLYIGRDKSLTGVANLLSDPKRDENTVLNSMLVAVHDPDGVRGWIDPTNGQKTKTHPTVSSVARELLNKAREERSGIISTALSYLSLFRDPIIAKNTSKSDFLITDLVEKDNPVSFYFVIPPSDIDRTKPLIRLFINFISRRLLENTEKDKSNTVLKRKQRLLLLLDEFISLGKIENFQKTLSFMAGYGIKTFIIVQDLAQLSNVYGRDQEIFGNCHTRIVYTPNKIETADIISKMSGVSTVKKTSTSTSGKKEGDKDSFSEGITEVSRPLLTPDEVLRIDEKEMIIFIGNSKPIKGYKVKFFEDPEFKKRSTLPCLIQSDRLVVDPIKLGIPTYVQEIEVNEKPMIDLENDDFKGESKDKWAV